MAFVGGYVGSSNSSYRRRRKWNENEVKIILERDVYFDGDMVRGRLEFDTTEEHVYEGAVIMLLCHFKGRDEKSNTEQTFCAVSAKFNVGTTDAGVLVVPANMKMDKTFQFRIPMHSPCSFNSEEGDVVWIVRFMTSSEFYVDTVVTLPFRKTSLYHPLPGFTPQARAERIWRSPSLRVLVVSAKISRDVYVSGEGIDVTFTAQCTNSDAMPIKKITAKVLQTVYVSNYAEHSTLWGVRSKKQSELAGKDFMLDRLEVRDIKHWVTTDSSVNGVSVNKVFSVMPRVDAERSCAHQVVKFPVQGRDGTETGISMEDTILSPSMLVRKELEETQGEDRQVHDQIIEVKYEVLVKIRCKGISTALLLSLPFNITGSAAEAETTGLTQDQIEEITMFPVTFDEDLPNYDEIDRLSVPTYSDTESLASVPSVAILSMPRPASARDLTQLANTPSQSSTLDAQEDTRSESGFELPRAASMNNLVGMLSSAARHRPETGLRRARSRQTSVSERRGSLTHAEVPPTMIGSSKREEAEQH